MTLDEFKKLKKEQSNLQLDLFAEMYLRCTKEEPESFQEHLESLEWHYEYEIFLYLLKK